MIIVSEEYSKDYIHERCLWIDEFRLLAGGFNGALQGVQAGDLTRFGMHPILFCIILIGNFRQTGT